MLIHLLWLLRNVSPLCLCAGPMFFLSCFSFVVGIALLYYYKGESRKLIVTWSDILIFVLIFLRFSVKIVLVAHRGRDVEMHRSISPLLRSKTE